METDKKARRVTRLIILGMTAAFFAASFFGCSKTDNEVIREDCYCSPEITEYEPPCDIVCGAVLRTENGTTRLSGGFDN